MDFGSKEYIRSRRAYMLQCTVEYFISLLVTDSFLSKLLSSIGVSDSLTGVISSFISLAFVVQLMSVFLVRKRVNSKKLVMVFDTVSILFFMLLYLIPFIPLEKNVKTTMIVISVIFAYFAKYLVNSILFKWCNSFVDPLHRAEYSAKKEMLSLLLGMLFTAVVGYVIDVYEGVGNLDGGFLFIAIAILVLNMCNFLCLSFVGKERFKNEESDKTTQKTFKSILTNTLGNKAFRKIVLLAILYDSGRYFSYGFMGTFKINDLKMSLLLIQVVNIIGSFSRMVISIPFGHFSDKYSFAKGFKAALLIMSAAFFVGMLIIPERWWLIIVYTVLYNCSIAGTNQNSFNIIYNYVNKDYFVEALSVKNCIGGIFGFLAAVLGGAILEFVQNSGNAVMGLNLYGQQVLSFVSLIISVTAVVFIGIKVEKEDAVVQ